MTRKKKIVEEVKVDIVDAVEDNEDLDYVPAAFKRKSDKPKAYYFAVEGHVDEEGNEIRYSTASHGHDFNCEWDLMSIIDRTALKFYLLNDEYKSLDKWPLTFKYYINPKAKAVHTCEVELAYAPVFSKHIKEVQ